MALLTDAPREQRTTSMASTKRNATVRATLANLVLAVLGAEGGIALALGVTAQPLSNWSDPSLAITAFSRIAAMVGTFFALVCLILIARVPWLEKEIGQDRLVAWHRKLAPYSLYLIAAHVLFVSVGYGMLDGINAWNEFWRLTLNTGWMLPAFAGLVFMIMVGVTSYKRARSKMKYETWWQLHLYSYLGITLSFMHQIESGAMFLSNDAMKLWWIALYVSTFGFILVFRWIVPFARSSRHSLVVEKIVRENHNTVSIVMKGSNIDSLRAQGGQFFQWRFLSGTHWWEAHPYSLSASPQNNRMRITVKDLGDHSRALGNLKPGTRVVFEGPYGAFTADRATSDSIVLIAGGVGITPIRALLEELPNDREIDLLWRSSSEADLALEHEIDDLARQRNCKVHKLVGSRAVHPMSPQQLRKLVPHIGTSEIFLCGPDGLVTEIKKSIEALGIPADRLHDEAFAF